MENKASVVRVPNMMARRAVSRDEEVIASDKLVVSNGDVVGVVVEHMLNGGVVGARDSWDRTSWRIPRAATHVK